MFRVIIFIIIIIIFLSKPAISLLEPVEALIFSPNVSRVDGGVHGHQAIVLGSLCITTVDHGARRRKGLHNAICSSLGLVICACAAHRQLMRMRAHAAANEKPRTPPPRARFLNCGSGGVERRESLSLSIIISVSSWSLQLPHLFLAYREYFSFVSCFYYLRSFVRSLSSIHFTRLFWSCFVLLCAVWPSDQGPSTARSAVDSP